MRKGWYVCTAGEYGVEVFVSRYHWFSQVVWDTLLRRNLAGMLTTKCPEVENSTLEFRDVSDFLDELKDLLHTKKDGEEGNPEG